MIKLFLKDLPYFLTQPMHSEYESKCRQLARWNENSNSEKYKYYLEQSESIQFIIALSIYYRYIVAPYNGLVEFTSRLDGRAAEKGFDERIRIGGKIMSRENLGAIRKGIERFHSISNEYGLDQYIFAQTDVRKIVYRLVEKEESRSSE
jgi:hypothetical protein